MNFSSATLHGIYQTPYLDAWIRNSVALSRPRRLWQFYQDAGYCVDRPQDVRLVPLVLREERVSRLRKIFRLYIFAEMGVSTVMGPAAPFIGLPLLAMILLKWSIDIGWCYGLDMREKNIQHEVGRIFTHRFSQVVWRRGHEGLTCRRLATTATRLLLMGWGQELKWADQITGKIRNELRRKLGEE